ncbi:Ig-like domain-containing protein [Hyalangium versicolor]|uniref:Ig-like domain-containing protein n=1 Tax=Hyalangium versicolor TaxID=2861190 RepID=UPI001CCCA68F|nr:Ig-like domain-containing protein [Hyalangium versicolor]
MDTPGAPFDLGSVIRRVHFAYRREGDAWTAGHTTWSARVTEGGLTFTPRHASLAVPENHPSASGSVLTGTPVTFGAAVFSRGGALVDNARPLGALSQEGALTLARGPVEEQLRNHENGIEQRWSLAHPPQGAGDLLIRVPIRGLRLAGETAQGVHFADASGLGVRYSHATWTDASGQQRELRAHAVAGAVEFRVPEALLATAAFPVMLAPTISPEFGLDTPVTAGGGNQTTPAVASNGTDYLVVWVDDRSGDADIYGTRVSQSGTVLDTLGLAIGASLNAQQSPAVAFDGTNYLVVWSDGRRGSGNDIYGARVSPAGSVLDPNGLALATSAVFTQLMRAPAIAFDGTNYLIVWDERTGFNGPSNLNALRVSPSGQPVGSPFAVSAADKNQLAASLAFDGTNYLAVWQDDRLGQNDIYGARISPSGTLVDTGGIIINSAQQAQTNPTVAFNGTSYVVVWEDARNTAATGIDLYGTRVAPDGSVLDGLGLPLVTSAANQTLPALARLGTQCLLAWQDLRNGTLDVYATRLDGAGTVLDASGLAVATALGDQSTVAVASSGTSALVTWGDARTLDIVGARVDATGAVLDPSGVTLSLNTNSETNPAVAFDGTNYLVVWQDNRGSGFDLYGVRVSASGTVLDSAGVLISGATGHQRNPAVAFDGTNYLVVWEDTRNGPTSDIFGARVSPAGTMLDTTGLPLCQRFSPQEHPAVAFDGTNYLVVWDDSGTSAARDIYGTRVSKSGSVLDPLFFGISTDANDQSMPALAFDGTNYLVAWSDLRNNSTADVYGARVSRTGAVLDTAGVQLASGTEAQTDPALAFDGTNYLLVWSDYQSFPSSNLFARRVRTTGIPLDAAPIAVSTAPGHQQQPSVVFDGTDFLIAWQDGRGGTDLDLYAGRVSRSGTVLDGDGFILSASASDESVVTLASGGAQGVLAVYQVTDVSLGSSVQRLKARRLLPGSSTNTPPTAQSQSVSTDEDVALALELTGTDAEGGPLTYAVATAPSHGALTGTAPKLTYVPAANYSGPDSFTFTVSDGQATSTPGTVSLTVAPVNDAPVASAQSVTTAEETAKAITLKATDAENDPLSFVVASAPSHGKLTGSPPNVTYTPDANYFGPDSFTFSASDGTANSGLGTVSITVTPVNDAPVATSRSLSTPEDTALPIVLTGTDVDGDSLSFALTSQPTHGTLNGTPPNLTYTPAAGYHGADRFTFTVSDGQVTSVPGTISLFVGTGNSGPSASNNAVTTLEDTPVGVKLEGSDPDGDTLSFTITSQPAHGTLTGTPPNLTYTPEANYSGSDSLSFTVSDGLETSAVATVSITVTPVNDAPAAEAQSLTVPKGTATTITLTAVDPEGSPVSFKVASGPSHGTLTGTPPNLTYTPAANYSGLDSFTFTASDGQATSPETLISLTIGGDNGAPVALAQTLDVAVGNPTAIALDGSDADDEALTFAIVSPPTRGTLTGKPPDVLYMAPADFRGTERFTFSVSDGKSSSTAEVQLNVEERALTVSAAADTLRPAQGQQVRFYANAVDKAGAEIALRWDFGDGQTSQEDLPVHTFAAPGTYAVRLEATTTTEKASTVLRVRVRDAAPIQVAMDVPSTPVIVGVEGSSVPFSITAPQSNLFYIWDFGDSTPATTGTTASHTWADDGSFTLKVTAKDSLTGASQVITRNVLIYNTLPVPLPQERVSITPGQPVTLQLSASDAAGARDPLRWVLVSAEGSLTPEGVFTQTPWEKGLLTVITKVIDGDGGESRFAFQISTGDVPVLPEDSEGCGCGTGSGGASGAFGLGMLLLALVAVGRRARN